MVFVLSLLASPKVILPASVIHALPEYRLSCSATGTPPTYTALIFKSTVLVNTTSTASIRLYYEGNYTCIASNKYGTDIKQFMVIFNGKTFNDKESH